MQIVTATDPALLSLQLAQRLAEILQQAVAKKGRATLVVSGGSTPVAMFQQLANMPLEWAKVSVTLADERCVEVSHAQSNAKLVREHLLTGYAEHARFVSLYDYGPINRDQEVQAGLKMLALPRFDAVVLGMGADGHTASIFPQASNLNETMNPLSHRLALLVDPVTVTPMRISQTWNRLLDTDHLILHITGEDKLALLQQQAKETKPLPIGRFMQQETLPMQVYYAPNTTHHEVS